MPVPAHVKAASPQTAVSTKTELNPSIEKEESYAREHDFSARARVQDNWEIPDEAGLNNNTGENKMTKPAHNFLKIPVHARAAPFIQPKLAVNTPGDAYEREADDIAGKVTQMTAPESLQPPTLHLAPAVENTFDTEALEDHDAREGDEQEPLRSQQKGRFAIGQGEGISGGGHPSGPQGRRPASAVPASVVQALQTPGKPLDKDTRLFMEQRFGLDFGKVRIHDDSLANRSAAEINALAYTHKNHVVFAEGQHRPSTQQGKSLLAHELVHVVQQGANGGPAIQRNSPGPELIIQNPGATLDENLYFLNYTTTADVTRLGVMTPGTLKVYAVNGKDGTQLLKTYKIKASVTPPPFLYILQPDGFYIYGYDMVGEKEVFIGKRNNASSPEAKKVLAEWGAALTVDNWFENTADRDDFVKNHQNGQFFGLWVAAASGSGAGSGGGDQAPPKPSWIDPYLAELKKLNKEKKAAEPAATDLPDIIYFYYSKQFKNYRASAKRSVPQKKEIQVFLEVKPTMPVAETLDIIRTKIRLKSLSDFQQTPKDNSTPENTLKNEELWALELLLGLRKKITEERKGRTDRYDLPDAIHLSSVKDIPDQLFITVSVNIKRTNAEGVESTEVKTARLPEALRRNMTVDNVLPAVQTLTLALREDRRKREIDPQKEKSKFTKILAAYPAEIIPLDTQPDFIGVKGGVGNYTLKLKFDRYEEGQLSNVLANMQTIYYRWYAFKASDFLDSAELEKLSAVKDWKQRRPLLVAQLKYKTLRQDSLYTWQGGWEFGADGEVKLPKEEGDIVVYGQAFVQPQGEYYRIPSEAFFPVHLVDGYTLAKEGVNAPENYLKGKKDALALEKAKGANASKEIIEGLEAEIAALEAAKGRSMLANVQYNLDDTNKALRYCRIIKKILQEHPKDFAKFLLSAVDGKVPVGDEVFGLFRKIVTEDRRPVSAIEKIDWAIIKINEQAESLKGILARADKFKEEIREPVYSPLTTFVSDKTATKYNLLTMLAESNEFGDYHHMVTRGGNLETRETTMEAYPHRTVMVLVDITSEGTQRKYKGISDNPDKKAAKIEATKNAYEEFGKKAIYGTGYVHYKVPGLIDGEEGVNIFSTPGTWEQVKNALAIIAAVAGVVALVVGTVASGGALGAAAVALGLGAGAIGAGLAIENIADRVENHTFKVDVAFAMDVLNIVGFFASATKLMGAARFAKAADGAADLAALEKVAAATVRVESGFMAYQRIETVTNIVLTSYQTAKDLEGIENSGLPEKQKSALRNALLRNALLSGAMIAVSIKDSVKPVPTLADEMSRLLKMNNAKKYIALNKELGLMDEHGNWLIPEMKVAMEGQETRLKDATVAEPVKAPADAPEPKPEAKQGTAAEGAMAKPAEGGGGIIVPPVNKGNQGGGTGGGKPKPPALDPESQKVIQEIDAKIADLKKRMEAGDTGAKFYIDSLQQVKESIKRNPGSETIANARETLADLATAYPSGNIVAGLPDFFKQSGSKVAAGDSKAILEFLGHAKTWKDAVSFLQGKGKAGKAALDSVQSFRDGIIRDLNANFKAAELANASQKPESDKDLNFPGENAGANLIKAEADMRAKYGDDWTSKLRMNFYTEGDRLTLFGKEAGNLPESSRTKLEKEMADLSDQLALAKMLKHAKGDPAATKRVEKLIETSQPHRAAAINDFANMPKEAVLARRDALHLEVDALKKQYNNPETPVEQRPLLAAEITKKQIEINFLTEEAYISPAALKIITNPDAVLTPQESVSALLANLEMMEHIIHQAGGDIAVAARQYEIYKYMLRGSKAMQHAQKDLFFDYLNQVISQVDRQGAANWTPGQLKQHYDSFMEHANKFLAENQPKAASPAPSGPGTPPAGGGTPPPSGQLELPLSPAAPAAKPKPPEATTPFSTPASGKGKTGVTDVMEPGAAKKVEADAAGEAAKPKPDTPGTDKKTPETDIAKKPAELKRPEPVNMKDIGAKTDPPQMLDDTNFSKVKLDKGHDALYILRDADGVVLKVGKTSATGAKGRFAVYKRAGKLTGKKLTLEVHQLKPGDVTAEFYEKALRTKMEGEGHLLPWDNTGQRLGKPGFGTPGEGLRTPPVTRGEMEELLVAHKGNLKEVGKELGVHQRTADLWAKSHGLNPQDYKK